MRMLRGASGRRGFTIIELLIVAVLGSVVAGALYQVLRYQQSIYREQRAAVSRHDALRLAASVLTADLVEASGSGGDIAALGPDSISIRSYVGLGIICAVDSVKKNLALVDLSGRIDAGAGDSLLIYHPDDWLVRAIAELNPSSASSLDCPYDSGPTVQQRIRVTGSIVGVPAGAPARAFHRYTYRLEKSDGAWWLARDDGATTEILAGRFKDDVSGLAFSYFDSAEKPTTDPAKVTRVDLMLVADDGTTSARDDTLTISLKPRNQ